MPSGGGERLILGLIGGLERFSLPLEALLQNALNPYELP